MTVQNVDNNKDDAEFSVESQLTDELVSTFWVVKSSSNRFSGSRHEYWTLIFSQDLFS